MRSPFKKRARPCTSSDARFLFLLLWGREPYSEAEIAPLVELSFFGATKRLLMSPVFAQSLIDPFLLGKRPMQTNWDAEQAKLIAGGAKSHFSLTLTASQSSRWPECFTACLGSERAKKAVLKAFSHDRLQYLADHLASLDKDVPAIAADIRQTKGTTIEGTVVTDAASNPVTLDVFLNGVLADTMVAEPSGPGALHFETALKWPGSDAPFDAVLTVYERKSGVMICPPKEVILSMAAATGLFARGQAAVDAIENAGPSSSTLPNMAWLTTLDRITNLPFDQYDLYRQLYQPPAVPQISEAVQIGVWLRNHDVSDIEKARLALRAQTYQNFEIFETHDEARTSQCEMVVPLRSNETLHPRAFELIAAASAELSNAEIIRFGYDHIEDGKYCSPVFVAKFDPLILQQMPSYATAFAVRRQVLKDCPADVPTVDLWQQVYLKKGHAAFGIVPEVLLSRSGQTETSKLQHLSLPETDTGEKLAIIIPTKDKLPLLKACIESLQQTIENKNNSEIIIVDNNSEESETLEWLSAATERFKDDIKTTVIHDEQLFNWAAINNGAARQTDADLLLFLNNDTQALEKGWDANLRNLLALPEAGVVGAKLLYEDRTVQHAGAILHADGRIKHEAIGYDDDCPGYQNRLALTRCCDAVTGAFMACRKSHFDYIGGFDEKRFAITYNDIDFCISTTVAQKQVIYAPQIKFLHLESQSRGSDTEAGKRDRELGERAQLLKKWAPNQLIDVWLPIQLAYEPGKQRLILQRVTKILETGLENRQKGQQ